VGTPGVPLSRYYINVCGSKVCQGLYIKFFVFLCGSGRQESRLFARGSQLPG
jgi:hypothetical protein